jgi:hypothetical protein
MDAVALLPTFHLAFYILPLTFFDIYKLRLVFILYQLHNACTPLLFKIWIFYNLTIKNNYF